MAAVRAIAASPGKSLRIVAARAYSGETPIFGPNYLIPSPFDQRLICASPLPWPARRPKAVLPPGRSKISMPISTS